MMRIDRIAARSRARRRRERLADVWNVVVPLSKDRHRDRLDLRHHHRDGRLRHRRRDGRPADRIGRQDHPGADRRTCSFRWRRPTRSILLAVVLMIIWGLTRAGRHPQGAVICPPTRRKHREPRPASFYWLALVFAPLRAVPLRPGDHDLRPVVPGSRRRPHVPDARRVAALVRQAVARGLGVVDIGAAFAPLVRARRWR